MKHGDPTGEVHLATFLGPDPELAFVHADLAAYQAAHPCKCEEQGEPCDNCNPIDEELAA